MPLLACFLPSRYMKYLYAYECEKKALSSPAELQAAIDGNRREGRRPSYSSSLFGYSPAAATAAAGAPALLSPPKIRFPILGLGSSSGTSASSPRMPPATTLRKGLQGPVGGREPRSCVHDTGGRVDCGSLQLWYLCQVMESR